MVKRHQENNDVRILARVGRVSVNEEKKTIRMAKNDVIGI